MYNAKEHYSEIIGSMVAFLGDHNASVGVIIIKIGKMFSIYQQSNKFKENYPKCLTDERKKRLSQDCAMIREKLKLINAEVLYCVLNSIEGEPFIYCSKKAYRYKNIVWEVLDYTGYTSQARRPKMLLTIKNKRTREQMVLSYKRFKMLFENEFRCAVSGYIRHETEKNAFLPEFMQKHLSEADFLLNLQWNFNHYSRSEWYISAIR